MSADLRSLDDLLALDRPMGEVSRTLRIGGWEVVLEGIDASLAGAVDRRWGGFVRDGSSTAPRLRARWFRAGAEGWLERWTPGDRYRLEADGRGERLLVRSYHFGACPEQPGRWRVGLSTIRGELTGRVLENVVRYLIARIAAEEGGLAFHGAVVLRNGRAFVFLGPSRSGKTTLVGLASPATSLGDDYAVVIPTKTGWRAPATPFDNSEQAPESPPRDLFPVAGLWRVFPADVARLESPARGQAVASVMGCVAFPWAMPDLAGRLLEHATRIAGELPLAHLHFQKAPDFWKLVDPSS